MTPKSFDLVTCKAMIGDDRLRIVEGKARADADAGIFAPLPHSFQTYWGKVHEDMEDIVYGATHQKRLERLARQSIRSQAAINSGAKK
ncbi:hypothetical protein D9M73_65960 [compost metagenome]|nr:MAG TPA: hypothetical protein [Caudoviricetes sp.]